MSCSTDIEQIIYDDEQGPDAVVFTDVEGPTAESLVDVTGPSAVSLTDVSGPTAIALTEDTGPTAISFCDVVYNILEWKFVTNINAFEFGGIPLNDVLNYQE